MTSAEGFVAGSDHSSTLDAGLLELGLVLAESQKASLLAYLDLMSKWNKVYNLTALRTPQEMLSHHVLDSLAVVQPLLQKLKEEPSFVVNKLRLLDVGSGAGLPGVVIAICCPEISVTCVDAVGKKVAFVQQVALALSLPNLKGLHARVETVKETFDLVCSRAFSSLTDFVSWTRHALAPSGLWLAMKGRVPDDEVAALPPAVSVFHVEHVDVPGLDAARCIVWMRLASSPKDAC